MIRQLTESKMEEHGASSNPFTSGGGAEHFFETSSTLIMFVVLGR
jgi:hypothetical protein